MIKLLQHPVPGKRLIHHAGDTLTITLRGIGAPEGTAFLRTNIGHAAVRRREIIRRTETDTPFQFRDWHDWPMARRDDGVFAINIPLAEVGRFEAKAGVLPDGSAEPLWPAGENIVVKVEPAATVCANSLYTAFVRQFGPNKAAPTSPPPDLVPAMAALDAEGCAVIPRSGTFRELIAELDHIVGTLGFRIVQLLPVHPVPTTYARMGRFGSPFASLDFFNVDPALAEFDRRTTPLDQFRELVDAVHSRGAHLFIDLPINHTGWASALQAHHPDWFKRDPNGTFRSPGAWGVTWEDLVELDYDADGIWRAMAEVFLFWCRQGVDGFRCDAGYMIPQPVWAYITARVRAGFPDTVFLLEGLGGKISVMNSLLGDANLDWAYSELFQCPDRAAIEHYLDVSATHSAAYGTLIHFAETHDNNRLAAVSPDHARMRTALAALLADSGAFGITNGVEWFATDKLDVHGDAPLNWFATDNQIDRIARLNQILATHPCFRHGARVHLIQRNGGNALAIHRRHGDVELLVLVNLDATAPQTVHWDAAAFPVDGATPLADLLDGTQHSLPDAALALAPAAVHCLSRAPDLPLTANRGPATPPAVADQCRRALALQAAAFFAPNDTAAAARALDQRDLLVTDPLAFCARVAGRPAAACVTQWDTERDCRRVVMLPRHHALLVSAPRPFRAHLSWACTDLGQADGLARPDGTALTLLFPPPDIPAAPSELDLAVQRHDPTGTARLAGRLLLLDSTQSPLLPALLAGPAIRHDGHRILLTNGRGAMTHLPLRWGVLESKYDALLAANLHPDYPVDRHVMWRHCRMWLVCRGYSQALDAGCLAGAEALGPRTARWHFRVPAGLGRIAALTVTVTLHDGLNRVSIRIARPDGASTAVEPEGAVRIIIRPDLEDRNAHHVTKAYTGPEHAWPAACHDIPDGIAFEPDPARRLSLQAPGTRFTHEPEWQYMVHHPLEAERGLEAETDSFSPGWFAAELEPGGAITLTGSVNDGPLDTATLAAIATTPPPPPPTGPTAMLEAAMRQFIVKRDDTRTVIAGYPWFLDWGRDTLICLRGIIAAGLLDEARDSLIQFARFERDGTLPNMIRGNDDSNRDTSDAPLWFFRACADLMAATGDDRLPETACGNGRTVRDVMRSIAAHYRDGAPNGIAMDPASALIFSPSHFTWMDTNFPAGTPREGYPIEIQALWHNALVILHRLDGDPEWAQLAEQVAASIRTLYTTERQPWLSDCLHAAPGTPAAAARPDDHLRPNQLFAITLGALDEPDLVDRVLAASAELLIPGAIRSLADRPVHYPLSVHRDGILFNRPDRPYAGVYTGDEDTRRKPAYHNGTAWTWPFPAYPEALLMRYGREAAPTARALLQSAWLLTTQGCLNQIPEILDGDAPHTPRGCPAQAWGVTELYRVWRRLEGGGASL